MKQQFFIDIFIQIILLNNKPTTLLQNSSIFKLNVSYTHNSYILLLMSHLNLWRGGRAGSICKTSPELSWSTIYVPPSTFITFNILFCPPAPQLNFSLIPLPWPFNFYPSLPLSPLTDEMEQPRIIKIVLVVN